MPIEKREIKSREEWLAWRKQDITASTIGALFNCHPYSTVLRLYAEKRGTEFIHEDNKAMRRGRWLEPAVAKAVEEIRPEWRLEPAREYLRDPELRLGATPDFDVHGDVRGHGILEAKSVAPSIYAREWADGVEVPLWIILQATVAAMLANSDFVVIAALLVDAHNMECAIHELPRNLAAEQKIREAVARFWHDVDNGIEPEPDFARDTDVIRAMWRREAEPVRMIDLSGSNEIAELLDQRAMLKDGIKSAEARCEAIESQIKYAMKDAGIATGLDGWRITYKTSHVKAYTVPARDQRVLRIADQREKQG